jgi:hypothetical protein
MRRQANLAGAAASGICLIHCLLTPLVISIFPIAIPYLPSDAWFHRVLVGCIVLIGAAAFVPGHRLHRRKPLLALICVGMSLILAVAWTGESTHRVFELALSISGALMLSAAHLLNRSFCRQCIACSEAEACHTTHLG